MSGDLRPWRVRTALRRSATQWRLLAVVAVVALLVGTSLTALALLLVSTEEQGVRGALRDADPARTEVRVTVEGLTVPAAEAHTAADGAVAALVAPAPAVGRGVEQSVLHRLPRADDIPAIVYLGHVEGVEDAAALTAGTWPASPATPGVVPVAVPAALAADLGLALGDRLEVGPADEVDERLEVEVAGVFEPRGAGTATWSADELDGRQHDPDFVVPGTGGSVVTDAYGPLVAAPGALDAAGVELARLTVRYTPDFAGVAVADVVPLLDRLASAGERGVARVGDVGDQVRLTTPLADLVRDVATAVVVTRASVLVVGLLLVVLAVAALLQTARLLAEARAGEQNLMRARGAGGRQLLGLAATEAALVALLVAAAGPPLARQVHLLLAGRPAMVAAGVTQDPGLPPAAWLTAAAVALLVAVVLVSPLLRRAGTFLEGEQARARPDRRAVLARSGLDVVLVVLASVAYAQLQGYRSPVAREGATLVVDPVLVAGPAVVLLAGALLCLRLLPAASRLTERIGARGRGVVGPLAAWEVGRRTTRATAAVLLLTLALAVGTFSQTFLATWRQSQADQAQLATGAAVVVQDEAPTAGQAAALTVPGVAAVPQPVARREAELAPFDASTFAGPPDGRPVHLLALTAASRATLDRGRMGAVSGARIAALAAEVPAATGVDLPPDLRGLTGVVRVGDAATPLPVAASLRLVLEDATGLLSTVELGTVPVDGRARQVDALLPGAEPDDAAAAGEPGSASSRAVVGPQEPLRLVGLQASLFAPDPRAVFDVTLAELDVSLALGELGALTPAAATAAPGASDAPAGPEPAGDRDAPDGAAVDRTGRTLDLASLGLAVAPLDVPADLGWSSTARTLELASDRPPDGAQAGFRLSGRLSDLVLGVASVTQSGWAPAAALPVVLSSGLAGKLDVEPGQGLQLVVDGALVPVVVADVVPRVPTLVRDESVVVDHHQLTRALVRAGAAAPAVDEWWVDVAPEDVPAYLAGLPPTATGEPGASRAVAQVDVTAAMQEHPQRVATQAALWLVTLAAALLAAVGFAVHATVSLRARSVEFAQLRAIGLSRRRLTTVVGLESLLLCTLGAGFGTGLGALLGHLVGPLVAVSATGTRPVPTVRVTVPWDQVALLALEVVAVLAVVVLVVARTQRSADPAAVMRLGDER
ncbi:ABC transporter permease [Actinotalea solisilvae]|uniref:ABC transporter permease n=1 Tax=Actinotalea solisilvae TaxID=2072922 RepID=UPI0018F224B1|nr:ABC transporter permease [Actinotalea solisilvae]